MRINGSPSRALSKKLRVKVLATAVLLALPVSGWSTTLLAYWDFNNVSARFTPPSFGTFATRDDAPEPAVNNGEIYDPSKKTLASNMAGFSGGPVFTNCEIDFHGVSGTPNYGTVNTTGFGAFPDAEIGAAKGDTATPQASLILINLKKDAAENPTLVFRLSSKGYQGLTLDFAARMATGAKEPPALNWSYSLDGTNWKAITSGGDLADAGSSAGKFVTLGASLPAAVDNLDDFYLRLEVDLTGPDSGTSFALDNIQLSGTGIAKK